ncbi:LuxR family transcriptional regulator [Komarekiella sp. 'clone 1']|uniref:LuxR family transcriptional regulator n=1 Tax=Komarekiella delphini-convector SJRDD-AB1 TaxID=2593771 RepID=A0AA40T431_9NOST|nr:LuxR C-terminal-related transcriptional regulator [Komarekiella delphini-convector]MBD6620293.1 LuxR family transcriptional regulator [Komarekiella delphini-convector SJRDD-AB1]
MADSLHNFFQALASARNQRELRLCFMDGVGEHFGVQRWGIYLLNEQSSHYIAVDVHGMPNVDTFVELYEKVGKDVDPVLRYVVKHHAPAHEEMVLPPGGWKQCELYQNCCAYYDHEHIMTGPIVGGGNLIGAVYFARVGHTPAFNHQNISDLSAVCTHLSACLATLGMRQTRLNSSVANRLTPREIQIAELVAQGLTNAEIGEKLWIQENSVKQALKRIFRKLEVVNRAEMVGRLRDAL